MPQVLDTAVQYLRYISQDDIMTGETSCKGVVISQYFGDIELRGKDGEKMFINFKTV